MKSSIWATCPKCQAELKIETDETELVQIECPDCHKIFAAKVPPRPATPVRDVFAQGPILPPFQPAHVHYKSRPHSRRADDGSLSPLALTAIIFLCASAILIPLGFGAYYIYGKVMESSEMFASKPTSTASNTNTSASTNTNFAPPDDSSVAVLDRSPKTPLIHEPAWNPGYQPPGTSGQPDLSSPDLPNFPVPQLDPPPITRPDSSMQSTGPGPSMNSGSSQVQFAADGSTSDTPGLSSSLQKFTAPNGVLIFVLHSSGTNVPMANLVSSLSVRDSYIEGGSDHSTIGLSYTGDLENVVKQIQFGKVTFVDEETRTIHVQAN